MSHVPCTLFSVYPSCVVCMLCPMPLCPISPVWPSVECPVYPISCVPLSCVTELNDLYVTYMSCKPHTLLITCILWHEAVLSSYSTCKVILLFYSGTNIIITMHNPRRPSNLWLQSFSLPLTQKHLLASEN